MSSSEDKAGDWRLATATTKILSRNDVPGDLDEQLQKWLAREGIHASDLDYCLQRTKRLFPTSHNSLQLCSAVVASEKSPSQVAGLSLKPAESIGRLMSHDPDFRYLVATVAALLTHHDTAYVTGVIIAMTAREEGPMAYYKGDRLLPVAKSVVEDIALHVVNCGHTIVYPQELRGICGHVLDSHVLVKAMKWIRQAVGEIVVFSNVFLADVHMWMLAHLEGNISVRVDDKLIQNVQIGTSQRNIRIIVEEACSQDELDHHSKLLDFEIKAGSGAGETSFTHGNKGILTHIGPSPSARQPFYDIDAHGSVKNGRLTRQDLLKIKILGQRIVKWIMDRPLTAGSGRQALYRAQHAQVDNATLPRTSLTVGRLLKRMPKICNIDYGINVTPAEFNPPDELYEDADEDPEPDAEILECFPQSRDLIDIVEDRCACRGCENKTARDVYDDTHCLGSRVRDLLWLVIAHAIADGFGAPGASNLGDFATTRRGVSGLMHHLVYTTHVRWDVWFSLAAQTYLGCPWAQSDPLDLLDHHGLAVVQYGSAVVIAPWIDLHQDFEVHGSFGLLMAKGRVCGMETNFGFADIEMNMEESRFEGEKIDLDDPEALKDEDYDVDQAKFVAQVESVIVGSPGKPYRLILSVQAKDHARAVNPAVAYMSLMRSAEPTCDHSQDGEYASPSSSFRTWPAHKALGMWDPEENWLCNSRNEGEEEGGSTQQQRQRYAHLWSYTTEALDTPLMRNALLALSPWGCVFKSERCCFDCAEQMVYEAPEDEHSAPEYLRAKRIFCVKAGVRPALPGKRNRQE